MLRRGFTLAEVLITLGIIGIVAALTLPSVIQKNQERAQIAKLKKVYSTLGNALKLAIAENGTIDNWNVYPFSEESTVVINNNLRNYFKYVKFCESPYSVGCLPANLKYKNMKGDQISGLKSSGNLYYLADGTMITIYAAKGDWESSYCKNSLISGNNDDYHNKCGMINVDTNGLKGPNKDGYDYFRFILMNNRIIPAGRADSHPVQNFDACLDKGDYFHYDGSCTAWVLENDNMDYLHCPEKLGWDKARKCN